LVDVAHALTGLSLCKKMWQDYAMLSRVQNQREFAGDNPLRPFDMEYLPDSKADEPTVRAREAVIATGVFTGAEAPIRAGMLDHTHGVAAALEVQRTADLPVDQLMTGSHVIVHQQPSTVVQNLRRAMIPMSPLELIGRGLHHLIRIWFRYKGMRRAYKKVISELTDSERRLKSKVRKLQTEVRHQKEQIAYEKNDKERIRRVAQKDSLNRHINSIKSYQELLAAVPTQEERDALLALVQQAKVHRETDKNTGTIRLSIVLEDKKVAEDKKWLKCYSCSTRIRMLGHGERTTSDFAQRTVCDSCLDKKRQELNKSFENSPLIKTMGTAGGQRFGQTASTTAYSGGWLPGNFDNSGVGRNPPTTRPRPTPDDDF
jgi:hypothetical protein